MNINLERKKSLKSLNVRVGSLNGDPTFFGYSKVILKRTRKKTRKGYFVSGLRILYPNKLIIGNQRFNISQTSKNAKQMLIENS